MRALVRIGDPKTLTLDPDHPEPSQSRHYTIRTRAAALTREELTWPEPLAHEIPVPGYDVAGVVISAPTEANPDGRPWRFKPGDEIYAMTAFSGKGNAREVSEAAEREMAPKPRNLGWEEAASVPLSALSAWQALFVHGGLEAAFDEGRARNAGKRVLITAASGGVGTWAVQLAHLAGAEIVGSCGTANVEFVTSLGADTVLDYRKTDLLGWVDQDRATRSFDLVVDCIGGSTLTDAWKCARSGGTVVSVAEPPDPKKPAGGLAEAVKGVWFIVVEDAEQLGRITELIERSECRPFVDSVFELEQYAEAFERLDGGHAKGKVVLKLY